MIKVLQNHDELECEIIDGAHAKFRPTNSVTGRWGIALHFAQIDKDIIAQLDTQGYVNKSKNFFVMPIQKVLNRLEQSDIWSIIEEATKLVELNIEHHEVSHQADCVGIELESLKNMLRGSY